MTIIDADVLVIGGGVNGAGTFRDLALQGVRCLLVERTDFGAGTSAAPSRLIHGGIKYLETGEFGLVAQSTLERNLLLQNAPHRVHPLPTLLPAFSWTRGIGAALRTLLGSTTAPRQRGALLVKAGLAAYDFYGRRHRTMPRHRLLGRREALRSVPALTPRVVALGTYHDARIDAPERLVWELVREGIEAGSEARNATELVSREAGSLAFEGPEGTFEVRPRLVINAAGPWIDRVNAALGAPSRLIGGTRGSHALLHHPGLVAMLDGRMIYFEADDGRICLVFDHLGRALVGSTDIRDDDPDGARCTDDEIDYFIESLRSLLPGLEFSRDQVVHVYSGIRPLPASDGTAAGLISRDHSAPVMEPEGDRPFPIVSLVGGKWTTFRGFAGEVADGVLARLGRARRLSTEHEPIGGGRGYPSMHEREGWIARVARETGLDGARIATLLDRYGTTAHAIARHEVGYGPERLPALPGVSHAEIDWIARHERVVHLADIVMRRTTLAVEGRLTMPDLDAIAEVAATALGWDDERRCEEVAALAARLRDVHRMRL